MCLAAFEAALSAVDAYGCVKSRLRISGKRLFAGERSFDLSRFRRIYVLAVGKASLHMTSAALSAFDRFPIGAIVIAPKGEKPPEFDRGVEVHLTGHPFPDSSGLDASRRVIDEITRMRPDELLLCLISGGASALLPSPAEGIRLADEVAVTKQLLNSGASIHEINTVRRHTSRLKGGRLLEICPASTILSLLISDVPGNQLHDIGSGLTAADPTTYQHAVRVLNRYSLWQTAPSRVRDHLLKGTRGLTQETPKPGAFLRKKLYNMVIADNRIACEAADVTLRKAGIDSEILATSVEMGAPGMGRLLAAKAREMVRPQTASAHRSRAIIFGGETTVRVGGRGKGGRNQEVALSAVTGIAGLNGVLVAAIGTDGVDGNSNAAGALVDGNTLFRARRRGLKIDAYRRRSDSNGFFEKIKDSLVTGPTGTNVGDIYLSLSLA